MTGLFTPPPAPMPELGQWCRITHAVGLTEVGRVTEIRGTVCIYVRENGLTNSWFGPEARWVGVDGPQKKRK